MVIMLSFIWLEAAKTNPSINRAEIISYFLFSTIFYSFISFHTRYIEQDIRLGSLTKYLLKPINPFWNYIVYSLSLALVETLIKLVIVGSFIYFIWGGISISPSNILWATIFAPFSYFLSFCILASVSALTFWIDESFAIRWAWTIIMRLLSGLLVPLIFFPENIQKIMYYLPFQHMAFTPIRILQNKMSVNEIHQSLMILIAWSIVIYIFHKILWRKGELHYEGTGI